MQAKKFVAKLLKRSSRFQRKLEKALLKRDHNADVVRLNELLDRVDAEIKRIAASA